MHRYQICDQFSLYFTVVALLPRMPTLLAPRDTLFRLIGRSFTQDEFDELCFSFGIELDDVTSEKNMEDKEHATSRSYSSSDASEEALYKIEVPANRYDLLSTEGLSVAVKCYLGLCPPPRYAISAEEPLVLHVSSAVSMVRPFVFAAVLRDVSLDRASYDSLIKLQDKLHQTLGRYKCSYM